MSHIVRVFFNEIAATFKKPRRILSIINKEKLLYHYHAIVTRCSYGDRWETYDADQKCKARVYRSYDAYVMHQRSKLGRLKGPISAYDSACRETLRDRLKGQEIVRGGMNVLCLGARMGAEVKAFMDVGCFAVGIDLNPGSANKYVLYGDFHDLQYPPDVVDVVFTNSLDHAFDMQRLVRENRRVLKPGGYAVLEADKGIGEGGCCGPYESFAWSSVNDIIYLFEGAGFKLVRRIPYDRPRSGEQLYLRKV